MKRTATVLVTLMLVIGAVAAVSLTGAAAQAGAAEAIGSTQSFAAAENNTSDSTNNTSVSPGAHLTGAVGMQEADLEGDIESRAFGLQVAKAKTDNAKAGVVAKQLNQTQQRVQELQSEKAQLKQAYKNGSISHGQYVARMAVLHAKINNTQTMANKTANASEGLPEDVLRANGVNVTAIKTLRQNAQNLSGPEVAAVARTIAGAGAGNASVERGPPGNRTAGPGNQTAGPSNQTAGPGNQTAGPGNQTAGPSNQTRGNQSTGASGSGASTPSDGSGAKAGSGKSGR